MIRYVIPHHLPKKPTCIYEMLCKDKCQRPLIPSLTYFMSGGWGHIPRSRKISDEATRDDINVIGICVFLFFLSHLMKERQIFLAH